MFIGKVTGNVWATRKHGCLDAKRMLLVRPMEGMTGELMGEEMMAVERGIDAGIGDVVLVMDEGNSARQILDNPCAPVRAIIVGVVDEVQAGARAVRYH